MVKSTPVSLFLIVQLLLSLIVVVWTFHCEKIVVFKAGVSPDLLQHGMMKHDILRYWFASKV